VEGKPIVIKKSQAGIAVEGHTDAKGYASGHYSNWELSTGRASAARKELEKNGLPPARLLRIAGYAATRPLIKENPYDPRNRRISIVLFEEGSNVPTAALGGESQPPKPAASPRTREKILRGRQPFDSLEQYLVGR